MFFRRAKKSTPGELFPQPTVQQLYPGDKTLQKTAERARSGDHEAQYMMGVYHSEGPRRDVSLSLGYLMNAARAGHMNARLQVAMTIMKGFDDIGAFGSFIGFCILQKRHFLYIKQDEEWIIEEARAGSQTFRFIYCMSLLERGREHEAFAIFSDDAKTGSMLAMGSLAYCYDNGIGTPQNHAEAYVWASLAATTGLKSAVEDREHLTRKFLTSEQLGRAQERAAVLFDEIFGPNSPLGRAQAELD